MLNFAIFCAESFPNLEIWIREHPAHSLTQRAEIMEKLQKMRNIKFVSGKEFPLHEVLSKSIVSVSIFSSTLMESLLYGSIPFIFNLTSMPHFTPDLDAEGLGIEVKTMAQAKKRIGDLLTEKPKIEAYQKRIPEASADYFSTVGNDAIKQIVTYINTFSNQKITKNEHHCPNTCP